MKDLLSKLLGPNETEMKLTALVKYLKVKFLHIPEHWECREDKLDEEGKKWVMEKH